MPIGTPFNKRTLQDGDKRVTITLPNAANQVNSNAIDLQQTVPFPTTEGLQVKIAWTTATGANNLNINFVIQDSAEAAANFANVASLPNPAKVLTSLNTVYAAGNVTFQMPKDVRRYLRIFAIGQTNGGNASDGTATFSILF